MKYYFDLFEYPELKLATWVIEQIENPFFSQYYVVLKGIDTTEEKRIFTGTIKEAWEYYSNIENKDLYTITTSKY
jgi:hypothetical protein